MPPREQSQSVDSVPVRDFFKSCEGRLKLELVAGKEGLDRVIREKSINRPALALTGYFKHFAARRAQLFGAGEMAYMRDLREESQAIILNEIVHRNIPCILLSRNLAPTKPMIDVCNAQNVPLFRTPMKSKDFMAEATIMLEKTFAPRTTVHGTMLDIKGIGTLMRGKSGIGKSECALALIERGHSLVADDHAKVSLVNDKELIATSSDLNRGYMECRGIGIINIAELFGIRSVRLDKRIDLIITFTEWKPGIPEERTGLEEHFYSILGTDIPHMEIPVRPGRDLARLVEVAAMVQAHKLMGHDSARDFNERLIARMAEGI